jgi:hypothetical protein
MSARSFGFALALVLAAGAAWARKPEPKPEAPKAQHFDFDDDQVEAGRTLPQLELIDGRTKSTHESLIRYRTTFVPELVKSASDQ